MSDLSNITMLDGRVVVVNSDNSATPRYNYSVDNITMAVVLDCGEELGEEDWEIVHKYRYKYRAIQYS